MTLVDLTHELAKRRPFLSSVASCPPC